MNNSKLINDLEKLDFAVRHNYGLFPKNKVDYMFFWKMNELLKHEPLVDLNVLNNIVHSEIKRQK
jgi:hypothetical protein